MPENTVDVLQERLKHVETSLQALQARIERLEGAKAPVAPLTVTPAPAVVSEPYVQPGIDATLIGKSVLIVGGGYVLRALTELNLLKDAAGIALGLVYALFWIAVAGRALKRGRVVVAVFDGATAAVIAASLIWEVSTRFHLVTASVASAMIGVVAVALLAVASRCRSTPFAVIAAVTTSVTSIGVAIGSADPVPPLIVATAAGVLLLTLSIEAHWPAYVTLIVAGAGHSLALTVIAMTAIDKGAHDIAFVELSLSAFAVLWLALPVMLRMLGRDTKLPWPALGQSVAAVVVGLGGAAILAALHNGHPTAVGVLGIFICAVTVVAVFGRANSDRGMTAGALLLAASIAGAIASALLLNATALPIVWAVGTITFAAIGRRLEWPLMTSAAACWSIAAFIAGVVSPALLVLVCAAAAVSLYMTVETATGSRATFLVVSTASLVVAAVSLATFTMPSQVILNKTVILVAAAVVLSFLNPIVRHAGKIAWILLGLCGLKLLVEDLRLGHATSIVAALVLYGLAIVIVARRGSAGAGAAAKPLES